MNQFVSGSLDGSLRHWNADDGALIRQLDHGAPVLAVAVGLDGKRFVTVGDDSVVKLWNAEDGELVAELAGDYRVHANATDEGRRVEMLTTEVAHYKGVSDAVGSAITVFVARAVILSRASGGILFPVFALFATSSSNRTIL